MTAIFGIVGYWLIKHDFEPAPMLLGFVLGPLMEENLRRAMLIARGDATVFFTRPISARLLAIALLLLILAVLPMIRGKREEVFVEERAAARQAVCTYEAVTQMRRPSHVSRDMSVCADIRHASGRRNRRKA